MSVTNPDQTQGIVLNITMKHVTNSDISSHGMQIRNSKRRRRIDRSMIGEPTNFVHTAHVGSGDLFSGMNSVSSIQNQMQSKGGYGGGMSANVQMQLVDTKAG
ncbi:CDC42 small effector protein 2 isoform 1-T1 [Spheniscus humboldti]